MKTKKHKKAIKYNIYMKQVNGKLDKVDGCNKLTNKKFIAQIEVRRKVGTTRNPKAPPWFTAWSDKEFKPLVKDIAELKADVSQLKSDVVEIKERLDEHDAIFKRNNLK